MRNKLALVVAVVLGLVAIYGVYRFLEQEKEKLAGQHRTVAVATASQQIPAGTTITADMLSDTGKKIGVGSISKDHILFDRRAWLIGQTINTNMDRGQSFFNSYFRKQVEKLHSKLVHGERALTLRVDAISGVAGNIVPGSHVDILGTFTQAAAAGKSGTTTQTTQTRMLLPNVTVLAVDNRITDVQYGAMPGVASRQGYGSVTVAINASEANLLTYAQKVAGITLALRTPADKTIGDAEKPDTPPQDVNDQTWPKMAEELRTARVKRLQRRSAITVEPAK